MSNRGQLAICQLYRGMTIAQVLYRLEIASSYKTMLSGLTYH